MDGVVGCGQQQQQRRQLGVRLGPMKALPLSKVVTNAAHLEATAGVCVYLLSCNIYGNNHAYVVLD